MKIDLFTKIPAKARAVVYDVISGAAVVELTLDGFGYGVVPQGPQAAALAVLAALGFQMARSNVGT